MVVIKCVLDQKYLQQSYKNEKAFSSGSFLEISKALEEHQLRSCH